MDATSAGSRPYAIDGHISKKGETFNLCSLPHKRYSPDSHIIHGYGFPSEK